MLLGLKLLGKVPAYFVKDSASVNLWARHMLTLR